MASRYTGNDIKKGFDGRRVYRSNIYPKIPLSNSDIYVATETGDRYDTLAAQYYGDSTLWWIIAAANNVHDAPLGISDGTILRIPSDYISIIGQFNNR